MQETGYWRLLARGTKHDTHTQGWLGLQNAGRGQKPHVQQPHGQKPHGQKPQILRLG